MKIQEAIEKQNIIKIKEILTMEPTCIDEVNQEGIPMSFLAARTGNFEVVQYIVEYSRASMNTVDEEQRNILHYGASSGNVDLVKYLVEKVGMSPVAVDIKLITPYDIAHDMGHKEVESYFEVYCGAPLSGMYRNPIRTGMYPDPSILRVDEDYYMVNSSFIFFPCIPISHSKDLIHWKIIGYAITNPEWANLDDLEGGRGYWAPDISYYEGRFYITATYRLNDTGTVYRKQMIVSSDRPEGPYSEPSIIDEDGIDPSIFNDEDGRRYMLLNRGARILELNTEATKQISEARLLFYGDQKRAPEGPHLLKKDGYYYLFLAEGGTGPSHRITVSRSTSLFGNYEPCPFNPIMRQKDEKAVIQRCGHGKPVLTQNGEWYMVYLCGRGIEGYSLLGRETALDPITWTADGWPMVNHLQGPSGLQKKPNLEECLWEDNSIDEFDGDTLGLEWMFPRPPEKDGYHLANSQIWLSVSKAPLSSRHARNILLRRQKDFTFTAQTKMNSVQMNSGQDGGMICYYDENSWIKYGVFSIGEGSLQLRIVEHIGYEDFINKAFLTIEEEMNHLYLEIRTDKLRREFFYSYDGETYHSFLVLNHVTYLSDEGLSIGKRFTGAMIGLYACGGEDDLAIPFEYFKYRDKR